MSESDSSSCESSTSSEYYTADEQYDFDDSDFEGLIKYHSKSGTKNKRLWKENKDKIINNFNKFKKVEKYTFSDYNNITLLLPNSIVKHGVKYDDNNEFYSKTKNYHEVYFDYPLYDNNGTKGLSIHT